MDACIESICLNDLPPESCGVIVDIDNSQDLERLKSMGVCLGRTIELIKHGDPLILKVFGSRIGMSARLAKHVRVQTCPTAPRCWERHEQLTGLAE